MDSPQYSRDQAAFGTEGFSDLIGLYEDQGGLSSNKFMEKALFEMRGLLFSSITVERKEQLLASNIPTFQFDLK